MPGDAGSLTRGSADRSSSSSGSASLTKTNSTSASAKSGPGAGGSSTTMYSMFPIVEKTYRVRITEDIERDLRFLGQSRVDALTSPFDMSLVRDKGGLKLYELAEKEFFTMKGVSSVNAPLQEVMQLLRMESTNKMRDVMGEIFGTLFLDGVVLYSGKPRSANESLSVNWMALQASKPNLPHRDYVFLRYGDVFEKNAENSSMYQSSGSGLFVGASIWESIELDGCAPLPSSQNVVRMRMRRCGIVVEETGLGEQLKISFYLSESHPGRAAVSTLTKTWMSKVVSCASELANVLLTRALAQQSLLEKSSFTKDGVHCFLCIKAFTVLRRKHHCRICGDVVCSKCSEMRSLRQGGLNKEVRICRQCRNSSTTSIRSSTSGGSRSGPRSVDTNSHKPSLGSQDSFDVEATHTSVSSMNSSIQYHTSLSDAYSEPRMKTHPVGASRSNGQHRAASSTTSSSTSSDPAYYQSKSYSSGKTGDMILLNGAGAAPRVHDDHGPSSEFAMYLENGGASASSTNALTPSELAQLELSMTVRENTSFAYALSYSSRQDWPKAPLPTNETVRLQRVRELHLVDPGQHFQEMVEYAAAEMGCQTAAVCFIGDKSGFLMARVGIDKRELPRNILFEAHAIMSTEPTIILDASEDLRFINNPMVQDGQVRFFAGFPLVTSDGHVVGCFSVADPFARELLPGDKYIFLKNLADVAIRGVEQNTLMQASSSTSLTVAGGAQVPPPPKNDMNLAEAHMTMQELLRTAYTTQCQVRMQVNPLKE